MNLRMWRISLRGKTRILLSHILQCLMYDIVNQGIVRHYCLAIVPEGLLCGA